MKDILVNINKLFESKIRLGIMSMLMVNDWVDFNSLKTHLDVTDGNLASHMASLEKAKYVKVNKSFIGKKPNTTYSASAAGRRAFNEHLDALERLINSSAK
ncbi:MAG: transcriptional regulator [Ignavibacteria bacterium]|nr:transcriptional regulator [Ignavibacteria bacterium]